MRVVPTFISVAFDHRRCRNNAGRFTARYRLPMTPNEAALRFYETHYEIIGSWLVRPGDKIMLGDKFNRVCRFCGKSPPEVTFKKVAHAIPESLGNKSIESAYECDACNGKFGAGIENDLGNWSKPMRTMARIRGKSGVPTLKKGGKHPGWRIEHGELGFEITSYEDDPIYSLDEAAKTVTFTLKRDPYTPVGVLKAFMKIGLTLLPEAEVANFPHLFAWVQDSDHSRQFAESFPLIYTFQPGPKANDVIAAILLRRKPAFSDIPYLYLVLGYGAEAYQVQLPSEKHDAAMNGKPMSILPFPVPESSDPERYGKPRTGLLDLTSREMVRGDTVTISMGYERGRHKDHRPLPVRVWRYLVGLTRQVRSMLTTPKNG